MTINVAIVRDSSLSPNNLNVIAVTNAAAAVFDRLLPSSIEPSKRSVWPSRLSVFFAPL